MNFIQAFELLKTKQLMTRASWPRGQFVYIVAGSQFAVSRPPLNEIFPEGTQVKYRHHVDIHYADGTMGVWTVTQDDLFAEDWKFKMEQEDENYDDSN